jgi:hypothetical protein
MQQSFLIVKIYKKLKTLLVNFWEFHDFQKVRKFGGIAMDKDRIKITTNPPLFKIVPTWHFIMQLIRRAFELSVLVPAYLYVKEFDIGRSTIVYSVDEHNTIHLITGWVGNRNKDVR